MRLAPLFVVVLATCHHRAAPAGNAGGSPDAAAYGPIVEDAYRRVREATATLHNIDSAVARGYPASVAQCIDTTDHGAMGYHHVNRAYLSPQLQIERPQVLIYEQMPGGVYALVGVEYLIPYRLWPRDSTAPTLMGRRLAQNEALQLWYLHMWVWKPNPAGLFADWNPAVACRAP